MITIEKAIEVLTHKTLAQIPLGANDQLEAVGLSIEALKAVEQSRRQQSLWLLGPLPGETKK